MEIKITPAQAAVAKLTRLCAHGGHWCRVCRKFVETVDGEAPKCAECGSIRLKFCEPVPGFAELEEKAQAEALQKLKTSPENAHV